MQRRAWILRVKEGKEEEYRHAHANVWPELIQASREAGFKNHSCFMAGRTVVAYIEAEDIDASGALTATSDAKKRWDKAMSELLEEIDSATCEEVFHFD
jgi:L-rhamnose mutarotase